MKLEQTADVQGDQLRIKYGFWVVITGLFLVAAIFITAIRKWSTAADVTAVVGSVTGVVGTIVGAFFGVQVGSTGKEKAEDRALKAENERKTAEDRAIQFASVLHPDVAAKIMGIHL